MSFTKQVTEKSRVATRRSKRNKRMEADFLQLAEISQRPTPINGYEVAFHYKPHCKPIDGRRKQTTATCVGEKESQRRRPRKKLTKSTKSGAKTTSTAKHYRSKRK